MYDVYHYMNIFYANVKCMYDVYRYMNISDEHVKINCVAYFGAEQLRLCTCCLNVCIKLSACINVCINVCIQLKSAVPRAYHSANL